MKMIKAMGIAVCLVVFVWTASGCSNAAQESSRFAQKEKKQETPETETENVTLYSAQALLGPLRNANVEMYEWPNIEGAPIHTAVTSENADDYDANGLFNIPDNLLSDEKLYLIRISGGEDIDVNIDGVTDGDAAVNEGVLHVVVGAEQIRNNHVAVTVLTKLVYQRIAYMLAARYADNVIKDEINRLSRLLIKNDINGDQRVDINDLVLWKPNTFNSALFLPDEDFLAIAPDIRGNVSIVEKATKITDYVFGSFRGRDTILGRAMSNSVYLFTNGDGLNAFDISNPTDVQVIDVSPVADAGLLAQVMVQDNLLFAATADCGARVYDLNFRTYKLIGQADPPAPSSSPQDIIKHGNTLYILQSGFGPSVESALFIYSVAEDMTLSYVDSMVVPLSGKMQDIGDYLYLATQQGLAIYSIGEPAAPQAIGDPLAVPGFISSMVVKDNYLLAANGETGMTVFDISTPESPQLEDTEDFGFMATEISLHGDIAYLENFGLVAMDVGNPLEPRRIAKLTTPGVDQFPSGRILFNDAYAFIPSSFQIYVSNLDMPGDFPLVSAITQWVDVTRFGEYSKNLYVINYPALDQPTFSILDTTDAISPQKITSIPLAERGENMVRTGDYVYVATGRGGVAVVNVSNAKSAYVENTFADTSGSATDVEVFSNYAFVADRTDGLEIYDISTPASPELVTTLATVKPAGQINQLAIKDNVLILFNQLQILMLNISNPALLNDADLATFVVKEIPIPGNPNDIRVFGDRAFATAFANDSFNYRIFAIDVTDPSKATAQSEIDASLNAFSTAFDGRFLYVAEHEAGMRVYDYVDMANPSLAYIIETPGRSIDVRVRGDYVYLADNSGGLKIFNKIVSPIP